MWVDQRAFAKLLQDNETRIVWSSDDLPGCVMVHVWSDARTGAVLLREYAHESGKVLYWASDESREK